MIRAPRAWDLNSKARFSDILHPSYIRLPLLVIFHPSLTKTFMTKETPPTPFRYATVRPHWFKFLRHNLLEGHQTIPSQPQIKINYSNVSISPRAKQASERWTPSKPLHAILDINAELERRQKYIFKVKGPNASPSMPLYPNEWSPPASVS